MVISLVVIAIALGGTLEAVQATVAGSADPMLVHQATAVGEAYLEEILLKPYYDPDLGVGGGVCPGPEASRDLFDNVCDYAGLDDAGARDQNDVLVLGLEPYRVRASVDPAATLGGLTGADKIVRVDVRVTHPSDVDLTLSGYRTAP
jgi:MSHA pilin protein MshD